MVANYSNVSNLCPISRGHSNSTSRSNLTYIRIHTLSFTIIKGLQLHSQGCHFLAIIFLISPYECTCPSQWLGEWKFIFFYFTISLIVLLMRLPAKEANLPLCVFYVRFLFWYDRPWFCAQNIMTSCHPAISFFAPALTYLHRPPGKKQRVSQDVQLRIIS